MLLATVVAAKNKKYIAINNATCIEISANFSDCIKPSAHRERKVGTANEARSLCVARSERKEPKVVRVEDGFEGRAFRYFRLAHRKTGGEHKTKDER